MGGWWGGGGRLFEAGRLLSFSAFRMGAYSRWALIRGWALIRINTVITIFHALYSYFEAKPQEQQLFRKEMLQKSVGINIMK